MPLEQRINDDYSDALRSGDRERKDTLRLLRAALKNAAIDKGAALDDEDIIGVLRHQAKMRRDSIEQFERGGRDDLVAAERSELQVIESYLPALMTAEEVEAAAMMAIDRIGATGPGDLGSVMRELMSELRGRADGKLVSDTVRRLLAG